MYRESIEPFIFSSHSCFSGQHFSISSLLPPELERTSLCRSLRWGRRIERFVQLQSDLGSRLACSNVQHTKNSSLSLSSLVLKEYFTLRITRITCISWKWLSLCRVSSSFMTSTGEASSPSSSSPLSFPHDVAAADFPLSTCPLFTFLEKRNVQMYIVHCVCAL